MNICISASSKNVGFKVGGSRALPVVVDVSRSIAASRRACRVGDVLLRLLNGDILVGRFGMLTLCRFIKLVVLEQVLSMIRGNKKEE